MATSGEFSTNNGYIKYTISVNQNSQNIANNTSNVTVSVRVYRTNSGYETYGTGTIYCGINGVPYSAGISPSQKITNSGIVLFSKTLDITHESDGSKNLWCSAWLTMDTPVSSNDQGFWQVLTTIPRKSSISASNGTLGTAQTITVNRKSTSFSHTITYSCGSASGTICTKSTATSMSFTPPLSLASQNPSGSAVSIKFTITTYNGNTSIGSDSKTISCSIPSSVAPSVSFSASDAMGYTGTYGAYIQGRSKVKVTISASGSSGSSITSYSTTIDGRTYSGSSITSNAISSSGTVKITVTVLDSRGRSATSTQNITVLGYSAPKITSFTVKRCDSNGVSNSSGAYLGVVFSSSGSSLSSKNTMSYVLQYKKTSVSAYTSVTLTSYANNFAVSNGTYVFAAETSSAYDVLLLATDKFDKAIVTGTGGTISVLFSALKKGLGWAFGKVAEIENTVDVNFDLIARKNLTVSSSLSVKGNAYVSGTMYDRYNTAINNGLATYTSAGIDPDTTNEHVILTGNNTPTGNYMYIFTYFYSSKTNNRAQIAIPYSVNGSMYHRYYANGAWSAWRRHVNADETDRAVQITNRMTIPSGRLLEVETSINMKHDTVVVNPGGNARVYVDGESFSYYPSIVASNGDGSANDALIIGIKQFRSNGSIAFDFNKSFNSSIRINYTLIRNKDAK